MAVTVKENVIPHPNPKNVIGEPLPRPESPGTGEDVEAKAAGELWNKLTLKKRAQENNKKEGRGPKFGHNICYFDVQKPFCVTSVLGIRTEAKEKFMQKIPHLELSKLIFKEIIIMAIKAFKKFKIVTSKHPNKISCSTENHRNKEKH